MGKQPARKVDRHPLAFGITKWGPLPETANIWIMWDGPGSRLYLYSGDPETQASPGQVISHPTADGTYQTVAEAERAVTAFVEAGTRDDSPR